MKTLTVAAIIALLACAYADVSELGYSYQQPRVQHIASSAPVIGKPERTYIPPQAPTTAVEVGPAPLLHSAHAPAPQFVPAPVAHPAAVQSAAHVTDYIPPAPGPAVGLSPAPVPQLAPEPAPQFVPASAAQPERSYVPPALVEAAAPVAQPVVDYVPPAPAVRPAPAGVSAPAPLPQAAHEQVLEEIEQPAQDGYRYKAVRRRVFRQRV